MSGVADERNPVLDCCGGLNNVDYSKVDILNMEVLRYIDVCDPRFCVAVIAIIFNPFFWNVYDCSDEGPGEVGGDGQPRGVLRGSSSHDLRLCLGGHQLSGSRNHWHFPGLLAPFTLCVPYYTHHALTHFCPCGSWPTSSESLPPSDLSIVIEQQPKTPPANQYFLTTGKRVKSGDYFGILMKEKVTGFPFNVTENPMYWGSTANYLGLALMNASPVGLVLTAVVALSYKVAIFFEGPFTEDIYRQRAQCCKHK
uniref:Phosphatidylethanolamine N-methyltransferase n=1 Tax=Esox lucius TaxID=8010 RepID=A0AAY5JXE5_ESOLU